MSGNQNKEPSLAFGGQALIEGVMIRSREHVVSCVRKPDHEILTDIQPITPFSEKNRILGWPIIRGVVNMVESLYIGFKALMFSASNAFEIEGEEGKPEKIEFGAGEIAIVVAGVAGMMAVFFLVPFLLSTWLGLKAGVLFNITEAVIRLAMFVAYLSIISLWGQYKRVLMYHGAEHKAIHTHEAGAPMDVEHAKKFSRLHPRCGTSFLFIVLIISIVLFSVMPNLGFAVNLAYRLLLIPVIAGISYELLRLSGRYKDSPVTKVLVAPGLAFQYLTTKEPTDDMLEVSLKAVTQTVKLLCPTAQPIPPVPAALITTPLPHR
ncbi:MAG: DUF1385 domain-containing protein [Candidatus Bathyarchaeota archaeon]|nr:DUF1385 domain-containing protein [Candidatus Bathyarchaeota archaeon]